MLYTTLKDIKAQHPCASGWSKLLKSLNKTKEDNELLSFLSILKSNGLSDALWCLRALKDNDRAVRLYAIWCARQVEHLDLTGVSRNINNISEQYENGNATFQELEAAREAALEASWGVAWDAAWGAAKEASWEAALEAARGAAKEAMGAAKEAQKQEFIKRFCTNEEIK